MGKFPCFCTFAKWIDCHKKKKKRNSLVSYRRPTKLYILMDYFPCHAMLGYGWEEIGKCSHQWLCVALGRESSLTRRECVTGERGWVLLSSCVSYIQNLLGLNEHRWQIRINREFFFSPSLSNPWDLSHHHHFIIPVLNHSTRTLFISYFLLSWGKDKSSLGLWRHCCFLPSLLSPAVINIYGRSYSKNSKSQYLCSVSVR